MSIQLEVRSWLKSIEKDNYENGCDPSSSSMTSGDDFFAAETQDALIVKLLEFCGLSDDEEGRDALLLNSCGEAGRIDIQTMENADGYPATTSQLEAFRRGEIDLYACTYSFNVESVNRVVYELAE